MMKKTRMRVLASTGLLALALAALVSCPHPLTPAILRQLKDDGLPVITLTSPADGSYCAATVVVAGRVSDSAGSAGGAGKIRSLRYEVLNSSLAGEVPVSSDGSFTFQFPTSSLGARFLLNITAVDWNGNIGRTSLTLFVAEGDGIPSFAVETGNGRVTLSWQPVALAERYDLFYTTDGTDPRQTTAKCLENVRSPLTLSMRNGYLHKFQLFAKSSAGEDNWSHVEQAIPLSPTTLAPAVISEFNQIRLEWASIPGAGEFIVLRSTERTGAYAPLGGTIRGTAFTDTTASPDQTYFYKIKPSLSGAPESAANCGQLSPFPRGTGLAQLVGRIDTSETWILTVRGDYAYIADMDGGMRIVDISDPTAPFLMSTYQAEDLQVNSVAVEGSYAFIGCDVEHQLQVLDVSNPTAPRLVGSFIDQEKWPEFWALAAREGRLYAVSWAGGLWIFDVSDPANPAVLLRDFGAYNTYSIEIQGDYAYLANERDPKPGLIILDVSDPALTHEVGYLAFPASTWAAVQNDYAYVSEYDVGLHIVNIADKSNPSLVATFSHGDNKIRGVDVSGGLAAVVYANEGLHLINVADPAHPSLIAESGSMYWPWDVCIQGGYAYVADDERGMSVVRIASAAAPQIASSVPGRNNPQHPRIRDDVLYVLENGTLAMFDLSDPARPSFVNQLSIGASEVEIHGNFLYQTNPSWHSIDIHDISDPFAPSFLGRFQDVYYNKALAVRGDCVYVANGRDGLLVLDAAHPEAPAFQGQAATVYAMDVEVSAGRAYVADISDAGKSGGLTIIDVANPRSPQIVGSWTAPGVNAIDVEIFGSCALLYDTSAGLRVIDVSNPASPEEKPNSPYSAFAGRIAVNGLYAYVAHPGGDLKIIDLSDPDQLVQVGSCPGANGAFLAVRGKHVYLTGNNTLTTVKLMP